MGFLTKKIKDEKKRNKVIIIVGIIEVLALVFFAITQRWGFDEGYNSCINHFCNDLIPKYSLLSIQQSCYNFTGVNISQRYTIGEGFP
jgi:hypothetical protein